MSFFSQQNINNFVYDPQVSAFDTSFWKTLSGSDPAVSGTALRITQREISTFSYYKGSGSFEFVLTVPVAPVAAQVKSWGLKSPALGNRGRIEFDITNDVFSAKVFDNLGNVLLNKVIPWDVAWSATAVRYRITIGNSNIAFYINEAIKAELVGLVAVKTMPTGLHINNGTNADNLDLTSLTVQEAASLS